MRESEEAAVAENPVPGVPPELPGAVRAFLAGERPLPAEKLKENRIRTVWRVDLPSAGPLLIKHYRYVKTYDRLRYRLFPDKAERETRNLTRLHAAGLPVPEPLWYERRPGGEACFVGRFLEGGRPWPAAASPELVATLARVVRRLHAARFLHRDLHLGNVLVVGDEVYLLDFHGGYFLPFLPRSWELRMLGQLVSSFLSRDRADLVRPFLREYFGRDDPRRSERVLRLARRNRARHVLSRSRRCVVNSTGFAVETRRGTRLFRRRELSREQVGRLLEVDGPVVSSNRRGEVRLFDRDGAAWCLKTVRYSRLRGYVARFSPGRLYQAWRGGNGLEVHGVGVAKPYAYRRTLSWGALREEQLLTEGLVGFEPLTEFLRSLPAGELPATCRPLAADLAGFMTAFHATNFWQHDLAPKNVMARRGPGAWEFRLIDLDRIRLRGLKRRRRLRNLIQLGAVPEVPLRWLDRARFLRSYDDGAWWNRETIRELVAGILAEMLKRIVHQSGEDLAGLLDG